MAYTFQVALDCAQPHVLADWWAETLGWTVEPSDEAFIRQMIDEGYAAESDTATHNDTLVWKEGAAIRSPVEGAPRYLFQLVPEPKAGKNRMHLDLRIGDADVEETATNLIARGATRLHDGRQGPHTWVTMADPEGNEFCVSR